MKVTKRARSPSYRFPLLLLAATCGLLKVLDAPAALCGADDRPHVHFLRCIDAAVAVFRSAVGARADGGAARRSGGWLRRCDPRCHAAMPCNSVFAACDNAFVLPFLAALRSTVSCWFTHGGVARTALEDNSTRTRSSHAAWVSARFRTQPFELLCCEKAVLRAPLDLGV